MTIELKTMDDFEDVGFAPLRDEAIKWVKRMRRIVPMGCNSYFDLDSDDPAEYRDGNFRQFEHSEGWIVHFFNITEEELK